LKVAGDVSVVAVRGELDSEAALYLLETVTAAARVCRVVRIDLHGVESMTNEAAALLLFRRAPGESLPSNIVLQANGQPGRQAILDAFARRRAGFPAT
jgi:ABC-type transporter Mla MlaB component